jgi:hypothetical protein
VGSPSVSRTPELLDGAEGDPGKWRREQHAERAEQQTEGDHGEQGDGWGDRYHPALHQWHDQVALDLLDRDVQQQRPKRHLPAVGKRDQERRDGRGDRPDQRHELGKAGEQGERQGGGHAIRPQAEAGQYEHQHHPDQLAEQPAAQGRARHIVSARRSRLSPRGNSRRTPRR